MAGGWLAGYSCTLRCNSAAKQLLAVGDWRRRRGELVLGLATILLHASHRIATV